MNDRDEFEALIEQSLHRNAEAVDAAPGPVEPIVARSHRRMLRRRAAGALAGAGALVLAAGIVTRESGSVDVQTASGGTTTAPGSSVDPVEITGWGTGGPTGEGSPTVTSPAPTSSVVAAPSIIALVPDPAPSGLLSSSLRVDVEPGSGLRDGQEVIVRGSNYPPGMRVGFAMCTTHGTGAATLQAGAGFCDSTSAANVGMNTAPVVAPDGTFEGRYRVRRNLTTIGGSFDCALGNVDPEEARALHEQGALGPASFPDGAWGCTLVAVVTRMAPAENGGSYVEYVEATADLLQFDPAAPLAAEPFSSDPLWGSTTIPGP